jgi:hypothetical protein
MSAVERTMLLVTSAWQSQKSFRLMPVNKDCPFSEGIYDPDSKVLVMMSCFKKQSFHLMPKLSADGDPEKTKMPRPNGKTYKEQRQVLETFEEFYITEKQEIEDLINMIAVNADTYDFKSLMNPPQILMPAEKKIEIIKP